MPTECKTTVGRIVAGHPSKLVQKRDQKTKALLTKPDGSPRMQTFMQVAYPKADFMAHIWPAMAAEIATKFPNGQVPPRFAYKYRDGDSVDDQGKPYANREGWAGCYVLTITSNTGFSPPVYKWNGRTYDQVPVEGVKSGDYVVCALQFQVNVPIDRTETPGLYVNPQAIELVGYGTEIVSSGVDPMAAFGGQTYQLPPGASATPVSGAPAGVGMPGQMPMQPQQPQMPGYPPQQPMQPQQPQMPGYPPQQPMQPQQPQMPGQMPGQLPPPAHDFVQPGQMQPQQPQMPGYPPQQPMQPQQPQMPGYPPQQPMQPQQPQMPGQMPGMPLPR